VYFPHIVVAGEMMSHVLAVVTCGEATSTAASQRMVRKEWLLIL
jgi:hypothetical protein